MNLRWCWDAFIKILTKIALFLCASLAIFMIFDGLVWMGNHHPVASAWTCSAIIFVAWFIYEYAQIEKVKNRGTNAN